MDDGKYIAEGSYKELEKSDNEMVRSFFNVSA
jgi:phospholipid/cholesterol/gamma-HCH transport system ATP-binding protein